MRYRTCGTDSPFVSKSPTPAYSSTNFIMQLPIVPQLGQNLHMRLLVPVLLLLRIPVLLAQDKTVDQGVYTTAQALLGERTFRLQQVYAAPFGWTDQKVVAKGFLTKSGNEERVNVTSMRTLTSSCLPASAQ